ARIGRHRQRHAAYFVPLSPLTYRQIGVVDCGVAAAPGVVLDERSDFADGCTVAYVVVSTVTLLVTAALSSASSSTWQLGAVTDIGGDIQAIISEAHRRRDGE